MEWKSKKAGLWIGVLLFLCLIAELAVYKMGIKETKEVTNMQEQVKQENEQKKMEKKIAYLTFDDGPSEVTERVLDVLKTYDIKATFFLIGENITEERKSTVLRMKKEDHTIGIHTFSHEANEMYQSAEAFEEDFCKAEKVVKKLIEKQPNLYRFPWGSANKYLCCIENEVLPWLENKGYYYCDWNVSGEDSVGHPTGYSIYRNVQKDYSRYEEPVILLHDSSTSKLTAQMLPDIIVMLKDSGYKFGTLDQMEKPYQCPRN